MSKKIILFLSDLKPNAPALEYACPDGDKVIGSQTNDAPVRYLLRAYPNIRQIICIVTELARQTAWENFQEVVREAAPAVSVIPVPYEEGQDFGEAVIPAVLTHANKDDEIFLEVTGGFRNANMHLLLLSRALSYKGVQTVAAVYSNLARKEIQDVSQIVELFEFVGGMQELTSFGSVKTLRNYYSRRKAAGWPGDDAIDDLLAAVSNLVETITLCRTNLVESAMEQFNTALRAAGDCSDPLMRALLSVFREKFGKKLTTPGLIKWCVQNGMIQQALTIYKERIPAHILRPQGGFLEVKPSAPRPSPTNYENEDGARFREHLLGKLFPKDQQVDYTQALEHLDETWIQGSYFNLKCSIPRLKLVIMDYLYIRAIRNMVHHANESSTASQALVDCLCGQGYKPLNDLRLKDVEQAILNGLENLKPERKKERKQ